MSQITEIPPPVLPSVPPQQGDSATSIILAVAYLLGAVAYLLGIILNSRR